jgi:hypothetical protein
MSYLFIFFAAIAALIPLSASEFSKSLYLLHAGKVKEAFSHYQEQATRAGVQDLKTLERLGLGVLKQTMQDKEPKLQLLALYSAGLSEHEEAESYASIMLDSPHISHQLMALNFLAKKRDHFSNQALYQIFRSAPLIMRLEAAFHLVQRGYRPIEDELESLIHRAPPAIHPVFPQLIAPIKSRRSLSLMRRFMHDANPLVRIEAISLACRYQRDDLLREIRASATHADIIQQECCANAFGVLEDSISLPWLQKKMREKSPFISLVCAKSLCRLGDVEAQQYLMDKALEGNLFAITLFNQQENAKDILGKMAHSEDQEIAINSAIALLELGDGRCMPILKNLYSLLQKGVGMVPIHSPGKALGAWRLRPINTPEKMEACLGLYSKIIELSSHVLLEEEYLPFACFVLEQKERCFTSLIMQTLLENGSDESMHILKACQQTLGSPHMRGWATLALFKADKSAVNEEIVLRYIKDFCQQESPEALIDTMDARPFSFDQDPYSLKPLEAFKLFLEMMDCYINAYPDKGIALLVESMQVTKPEYYAPLSGLLLRAMQ